MKGARPLLIALTGGIATGKSTVSNLFRRHGARLISADQLGRDVLAPGGEGTGLLRRHFGERFADIDFRGFPAIRLRNKHNPILQGEPATGLDDLFARSQADYKRSRLDRI